MEFEKPTSATAFSKKLSNAPTSVKQHPYDGVFLNSTPAKLRSSRAIVDKSEYEEMFCGSATCSIPVLDIPDFHQGKASLDARSSRQLDYSQIFGGFGDSTDFAVPFEELVPKPKKKGARSRTPVEAKPRTARSGHSSSSEEKQEYSADGLKLYNVSYNRTNPGSQNGEKGTAHVAQLHAVNGYTHVINESGPSPVAEGGKPERSVLNDADAHLNVSVSEPPRVPKLYRKVVSGPQPRVAASDAPQIHAESRKRSGRNRSMSNDMFDAFEIGLGGYPSGIPSPSSTTSKGTTHVAQPQAVNGYARVIDKSVPSPVAEGGKPAHSVLNNAGAHLNVSEPPSVSGPQPRVAASDAPQIHAESMKRSGRNRSMSNDMFDAFEIGFGGYPSGIPSPSSTTSKGTTHVAQPQAVNGYTRVIDKSVPSPVAEGGKPAHSVLNDDGAHLNVGEPPRVPKLSRKAVSGPQPRVAVSDKSQIHAESMKRSGRNRSMSNDMFDAFEIGLAGYSAGVPSPSSTTSKAGYYRGVSNGSTNMKFGASRSSMSERAAGYYSPSFSDEEVDKNSAAAASAAAVRKAIEEAQAKIKLAKELMERKKEGRLNFAKLNSDNGLRAGKRETKTGDKSNSLGEKGGWKTNEKEDLSKHFSANLSKHEQIEESQVSPQLKAESDVCTTQDVVGKPQSEGSPSTQADHILKLNDDGELRPQISQSAVAKKHVAGTVEFEPVDDAKEVTPSAKETGWRWNMTAVANFEEGMQCSKKMEVFEEDAEQGKVESKMDPVEGAFAWNVDANSIELSQELEHKEEDVEVRDACELGEANETPNVLQKQEQLESKPEVLVDQGTKHKPESQGENIDMQEMKEAFDRAENIDHKAEECSQDPMANGVPIREDCERRQDERHEQNGKLNGHKCEWERVECVENQKGSSNHENNEQRENDAHWEEDTEMKLGKVCVQQVVDFTCNDLQGEVESERIDSEDDRTKGHDKVEEVNTIERRLEGDYQMGVSEHRPDSTFEAERMQLETCLRTEDEEAMEVAQHTVRDQGSNSAVGDVICNEDGNENPSETGRGFRYGETSGDASINAELITSEPNGRTIGSTGDTIRTEESEREWKPVEDADDTEEEETFEAVRPAPGCIRLDEFPEQTECGTETLIIENDGVHVDETMLKSPPECLSIDDLEKYLEEVNWEVDESDEDVDDSEVRCNDEQSESYFISENGIESQTPCVPEQSVEEVEESKTVHDLETYFEEVTFPLEEDGDADEFENATVHGEEDNSSQFSHKERWTNSEIYVEVVQQPCSFEGSGRTAKISQEMKVCQGDEKEDKNHHKAEEKEAGSQMEMGVENEHHSEKDEAKEKEMERWTNSEIHVEVVQQPCSSEGSGRTAKISQEMKACQSTEIEEENDHKAEEKEAGSQMEMGVENKHQSEKDKVKEREMERWTNSERHVEVVQQHCSSEGSGRTAKISQETKACQSTEKEEENHHKAEEKEARSQMEMGVENKDQSEKEEAKEREMEKERQRMVVERAIREARERAFAEARERAERAAVERAAAEARQKVMAEAWKRLEKAPVEANGKLAADKVAMEAKLKAERAAVERATAEARERALERALAEKAASKAKNQASAEKFSSASRGVGTKSRINSSTDDQQKGTFTSSSLRHSTSSNHAAPNTAERPIAPNGESAHWSKATLERHQRTAERAAKALAEKNMRDLLAQKEQAERNRLAETLDADVKRWSSGKERNLRALISTLQYILGPDSGWQPIPLTDLISTAAVKKAYRKATLFVHPDKLQQRGASIQQKYICEKVFDLLKEAWNKFSAEER